MDIAEHCEETRALNAAVAMQAQISTFTRKAPDTTEGAEKEAEAESTEKSERLEKKIADKESAEKKTAEKESAKEAEEAAVWEDGDYDWVLREEDGGHGRHLGMRYK